MEQPTAKDLPKLKTQLPDPLMIITFGIDQHKRVAIRLTYASNPNESIFQGIVYQPDNLLVGLQQALEASK